MEKTLEQFDFETSNITQNSYQIEFRQYKTLQIATTDIEKDNFFDTFVWDFKCTCGQKLQFSWTFNFDEIVSDLFFPDFRL